MDTRLAWYNDAKIGLFVHWGPFSVAGVEASWPIMVPEWAFLTRGKRIDQATYENLPSKFNPVNFDADLWVRTIQDAGLGYLVFTSKHHDGFCMFDAPGTEYKITNTPFKRDIVGELSEACDKAGLRFGLYYSPPDMHHPGFRDTTKPARKNWYGEPERPEWGEYIDYMLEHLKVLLTEYGDISALWFDGLFDLEKYQPDRVHDLISSINPDILVNDRIGGRFDYITPEQGLPEAVPVCVEPGSRPEATADGFRKLVRLMRTPILRRLVRKKFEQLANEGKPINPVPTETCPAVERFQPWETCMTMNRTWAYDPDDTNWKSTDVLIRTVVDAVSRGGNVLMNVGPKPDGTFPDEAISRLSELGRWLEKYGDAVRGSTFGPVQGTPGVASFRRGDTIYVAVTDSREDGVVRFPAVHSASRVRRIDSGEVSEGRVVDGEIEFEIPGLKIDRPVVFELLVD